LAWIAWQPEPSSSRLFDKGRNGIWIGHQWYTGVEVRTGRAVTEAHLQELLGSVRRHRIRYLFVHAGPVRSDASIRDRPGPLFDRLMSSSDPDLVVLPWLGARVTTATFEDLAWRKSFVETLDHLRHRGLRGVHLDFEPIQDRHPYYVTLLKEIREHFGEDYFLSHATRRAGPYGKTFNLLASWFWSEEFYRATMKIADQTVLMAYDTKLPHSKLYVGFVKHETELLLDWAADFEQHRVLIGVPTYEDAPKTSDPRVENISNSALGVRAGLEESTDRLSSFEGVAIYSHWVTDREEWRTFRSIWLGI
jgi:hypothetical protein